MHDDSPQAEINKMNNILHNEVEVKKQTLTCIGPKEPSFLFFLFFLHSDSNTFAVCNICTWHNMQIVLLKLALLV